MAVNWADLGVARWWEGADLTAARHGRWGSSAAVARGEERNVPHGDCAFTRLVLDLLELHR